MGQSASPAGGAGKIGSLGEAAIEMASPTPLQLPCTVKVGVRLPRTEQHKRQTGMRAWWA